MTLGEMRAMLLDNILDPGGGVWSGDAQKRYINAAMRHIANFADRRDQALFVASAAVAGLSGSSSFLDVPLYGSGFNLPSTARFRRLLGVWRTDHADGVKPLQVIDHEDRSQYAAADSELPKCYIAGQKLGLVTPVAGIDLRMDYVQSLPDMTVDSDTPGQSGGSGTADLLPPEYHALVPTYATVLALRAENLDATGWAEVYAEQREELQQTLDTRRGARK